MSSASATPLSLPCPAVSANPRFLHGHLWLPLLATLAASTLLMSFGGDQWLADQFYRLEGHHWALQDAWATQQLVHKGGKWASTFAALVVVLLCTHAWRNERAKAWRWPLLYLVLTVALGTGLVSLLKSVTNMDCPWDLARYGGLRDYVGLFASRPHDMPRGICFPAGHSSAGFAWIGLYFFALMVRPAWRWRGLAIGLVAGGVFGLAQQLRGAHFLSHDLWTLATCWLLSLALYLLFQPVLKRTTPSSRVVPQGEQA